MAHFDPVILSSLTILRRVLFPRRRQPPRVPRNRLFAESGGYMIHPAERIHRILSPHPLMSLDLPSSRVNSESNCMTECSDRKRLCTDCPYTSLSNEAEVALVSKFSGISPGC